MDGVTTTTGSHIKEDLTERFTLPPIFVVATHVATAVLASCGHSFVNWNSPRIAEMIPVPTQHEVMLSPCFLLKGKWEST